MRCVASEYVIVCGHVQCTYTPTYHYVNERRRTHAYVMPDSITFMDFRYRKWNFFYFLQIIFGPRNVLGNGHFHLRSAAFVYVTPLFSTYLYVIIHFLLRGQTYESVSLFTASVTGEKQPLLPLMCLCAITNASIDSNILWILQYLLCMSITELLKYPMARFICTLWVRRGCCFGENNQCP